jgi:histidinol-phosphate/aromatic aminotransferase/cobyric acid decarboxylase-like protein
VGEERQAMTVEPLIRIFDEMRAGSPAERQHMQNTYKNEDIEQILAEADDLLKKIDPEINKYREEEQRAQLEQQAQSLKKLKSEVQDRIGKEKTPESISYGEGMHEAIEDIVKAMKGLTSYL